MHALTPEPTSSPIDASRRRARRVRCAIAAIAIAGAAACGDREVDHLSQVKARVCACKDVACAEAALKDVPQGDVKSSHHAQTIARDMLDCLAKLYDAQRPSTDPDAGSVPGGSDGG